MQAPLVCAALELSLAGWNLDSAWDQKWRGYLQKAQSDVAKVLDGAADQHDKDAVDKELFCPECYFVQFFDAVMIFANAADKLLRDNPKRDLSTLKGPDLFKAMTKNEFTALQGRMVIDLFGTKEGHFVVRNVWGQGDTMTLPPVLLLDTLAVAVIPLAVEPITITGINGQTWTFQSSTENDGENGILWSGESNLRT